MMVVLVTTLLYGASVVILKERLEAATYEDMLQAQLTAALESTDPDHYFDSPSLSQWSLFRAGALEMLPPNIRELEPGTYHSIEFNDRMWHLEVAVANGQKMVLGYDITEWEEGEHIMLWGMGIGAFVAVLLALLLGRIANAAIVAPVTQFQSQLEALNFEQRDPGSDSRFLEEYGGSEIAPIAQAFDRLLTRVHAMVERERSFTGSASHELRSSLAVMQGALDVLEAQPDAPNHPALMRIRRAADEMAGFVEAALFLAREEAASGDGAVPCDMVLVVTEVARQYAEQAAQVGITLQCETESYVELEVPPAIATIAVANMIRNALQHSNATELLIQLDQDCLLVSDNGDGIDPELIDKVMKPFVTGSKTGTGLGLALIQRICTRFGWRLSIESGAGRGTKIAVYF